MIDPLFNSTELFVLDRPAESSICTVILIRALHLGINGNIAGNAILYKCKVQEACKLKSCAGVGSINLLLYTIMRGLDETGVTYWENYKQCTDDIGFEIRNAIIL